MLFPARTEEAFGMILAESMACGTPLIAYNFAAIPEVVKHSVTGFITENINEMELMISNNTNIDRKSCHEFAKDKFDVSIVALNYLSLFN